MPDISNTDRTTPLLRARIRDVFRRLPKALAGDEEAIHDMRVAGRRLRVALPHLARRPSGKRVRRAATELKRLTRAAGSSRDLDVMLGIVEEKEERRKSPEQALLLRRLRAARARSRARMAEALLDLEIARLRRDLRAVVARKGEIGFAVLLRLGHATGSEAGALLATFETLGTRFDPEALHGLRIRARRLRYTVELRSDLMKRTPPAPPMLKQLQGQLGRIRDLFILASWFGAQAQAAGARGQTALATEARRRKARHLQMCRAAHRELLETRPAARLVAMMKAIGLDRPAA